MPAQFTTTLIPPNARGFEHILEGGFSADVVAKVAGMDAETWMKEKIVSLTQSFIKGLMKYNVVNLVLLSHAICILKTVQ